MARPNLDAEEEALLWKAVHNAEAEPTTFLISTFGHGAVPTCETPCCIAGHICFAADGEIDRETCHPMVRACDLLGLDANSDEANSLFSNTQFKHKVIEIGVLTERVNHWLATGE